MAKRAKLLSARQIKSRVRYLIAHEIRQRLAETPDSIADEPQEVIDAWPGIVWDIADSVWHEDRPSPHRGGNE